MLPARVASGKRSCIVTAAAARVVILFAAGLLSACVTLSITSSAFRSSYAGHTSSRRQAGRARVRTMQRRHPDPDPAPQIRQGQLGQQIYCALAAATEV